MGWPQITWIVLAGVSLGIGLVQHGKPRTGTHSIWITLISLGLGFWLLSAGGFFS